MAEPLFVRRWGSGPPVVLLHGLGASSRYWESVAATSARYQLVAPDLLGFGRSPSPPDAAYDVSCHLDAMAPYVPDGAVVVGHSTGAILAAALAGRGGPSLRGLVLVGLPAFPDAATARAEIGRLGLLARLTVDASPWARRLCLAMCRVRPLAIAVGPLVVRDLPPAIASDAARHTWPSYSRTLDHVVVGHRVGPDLARLRVPVVLLHGHHDRVAPLAHVRELAAANAHVELRVVDGDHHVAVRRPHAVTHAVAAVHP